MSSKIEIRGFKCFRHACFDLNRITVLCGSNGSGKSSVIQSVLLMRLAIENALPVKENQYYYNDSVIVRVPLNGAYELSLGVVDDIVNSAQLELRIGDYLFQIDNSKNADMQDVLPLQLRKDPDIHADCIGMKAFYYLHAERLGPRYISDCRSGAFLNCGCKGENTAYVFATYETGFFKVDKRRRHPGTPTDNFRMQVDAWLDYICPGITLMVESAGKLNSQIRLRNKNLNNVNSAATNIGFGISYLLPVLITGLIAEEGTMFIVENPEAHLHPQAQSRLGYFLGFVAGSGVRVIVETHSEHVINGIRRVCLTPSCALNTPDVNIYFFDAGEFGTKSTADDQPENEATSKLITIEPNGDLSSFPVNFFDQTRQDLLEIIKLSRENG